MEENRDYIEEHILIAYLNGNTHPDVSVEVERWRKSSLSNETYFRQIQNLWEEAAGYEEYQHIDLEARWAAVQKEITALKIHSDTEKMEPILPIKVSWTKRILRIAAIFMVLMTFAAVVHQYVTVGSKAGQTVVIAEENMGTKTVTLPDRSTVWLKQGSNVTYASGLEGKERRLSLEGEAYFEVVHHPDRPFVVTTKGTETRVLGTSFHIKSTDGPHTELVLITGSVAFSKGRESLTLVPGESVSTNSKGELIKKKNMDPNFMSWKTESLIFEDTPMKKVVEDIKKLYQVDLLLDDESFGQCPLTAVFEKESLEKVLETLSLLFTIEVRAEGATAYRLSGKGC